MGQKVNPIGIRLAIIKDWNSKWFAGKRYAEFLIQDIQLRQNLKKKLSAAAVSKIVIQRPANNAVVTISTARPGVIIGKKGGGIDTLRSEISKQLGVPEHLTIEEIKNPE
jgi:small subunit ribosomal protein S3